MTFQFNFLFYVWLMGTANSWIVAKNVQRWKRDYEIIARKQLRENWSWISFNGIGCSVNIWLATLDQNLHPLSRITLYQQKCKFGKYCLLSLFCYIATMSQVLPCLTPLYPTTGNDTILYNWKGIVHNTGTNVCTCLENRNDCTLNDITFTQHEKLVHSFILKTQENNS